MFLEDSDVPYRDFQRQRRAFRTDQGFFNWFQAQNADVLCIQELKAQEKDIPAEVAGLPGYQAFFHCAEKKGYSGCGIWCRRKPDEVRYGFGDPEFDAEGAMLRRSLVISASSPAISHRLLVRGTSGGEVPLPRILPEA